MSIRLARKEDSEAIRMIYDQYMDSAITFEYETPSADDFAKRVEKISEEYPYLVYEENGVVFGYAYAVRQMERAAYAWNATLSVYLDQAHLAKGIGKKLYCALMELLRLQNVHTVYGGVTVPNEPSRALHLRLGFTSLGVYHRTGYKNQTWWDVEWFEKELQSYDVPRPWCSFALVPLEQKEEVLVRYQDG